MRNIDFSSWQSLLATVFGLALVTLIGVGIRLLTMVTIQQRRERTNRQINERLRTLIAAYKTLGGSFTGTLTVDPAHRRDLRQRSETAAGEDAEALDLGAAGSGSDRARRIRDAVEAALSDIILLGTDEQVQLAARAAHELVAGRPVPTYELVVSMRDFIREALDLDPIPRDLALPAQGPSRPPGSGGEGKTTRARLSQQEVAAEAQAAEWEWVAAPVSIQSVNRSTANRQDCPDELQPRLRFLRSGTSPQSLYELADCGGGSPLEPPLQST